MSNRLIGVVLGVVAVLVLAIGVVSALVIINSGGDNGGEPARESTEGTPGAEDGGGQAEPRSGAELRLPGSDPITLDPALASDAASATYIVEIFGGLATIDPDLNIVPDIAERWEISPDGTVYTFHLRDDVVFHNTNRLVTAADFKYSMERAADPETASTVADAYLGDIVGVRDKIRGRADEIEGVRVIDDQTLEITIDAPKSYFLAKLTYPTAYVVDEQQVESNPRNWTRKPNGTGPFKMKEWRLGERITLEANERYHLGAPGIEQATFLLAGGSVLTMYENGEIDFSSVSIRDIDRVLDPSDPLHEDYVTGDELSVFYLGFNTETAPFDDPKVRQAFAGAIDRETITRVVLRDMLPVADGIVPPGVPGYTSDAQALDFDPEGARQLLEESTYGGPDALPDITLTEVGGGATVGLDTQAMIEMWKENLDVTVEIEQTDAATFFADLDAGRHQLFASGWVMDYPDPQNVIDILFYSTSRQNNARYNNPEVDRLIEEARTEQDEQAQFDLYSQAEDIIVEDAAWIPLYFGRDHALVKPYVKGLSVAPMVIPRLRYVSIEQ